MFFQKTGFCILSILYLTFWTLISTAQNDRRFYTLTEKDGLNSNIILRVAEDGIGFIWIATQNGLSRFDGYGFRYYNYNPADSTSLNGNNISDIKTDKNGNLWIATERGVSSYNIETEKFTYYHKANSLGIYQAEKIFFQDNGNVYYFNSMGLMCRFNHHNKKFEEICPEFFGGKKIRYCFQDESENFWAISEIENKIYRITPQAEILNTFEGFSGDTDNPCNGVFDFADYNGTEFYIGGNSGLFKIDVKNNSVKKITTFGSIAISQHLTSIYKDKNQRLWIGSNGDDLYIMDIKNNKSEKILSDRSRNSNRKLNSTTVICMFEDSHGLMWFGTWNGLSYMETNPTKLFENISYPENKDILKQNLITSISETPNGLLIIGSDGGGLTLWDKKSEFYTDVYPDPEGKRKSTIDNPSILAICTDNNGNIYNGGYLHNLHIIDKNHQEKTIHYSKNIFIRSMIYQQKTNSVWINTCGQGLLQYNINTQQYKTITEDKNGTKFCSTYGTSINLYQDSLLLVGTYQGLSVYNIEKNEIKNYSYNEFDSLSISHNWALSICIDSKKRIWIATPSGLNQFNITTGKFKYYGFKNGFQNLMCNGIVEDNSGYLWITTGKGIVKFSPDYGYVIRTYHASDGIISDNYTQNSIFKDQNGTLYFGANEGMVYFNPQNIREKNNVPSPTITGLLINYKHVTIESENSPLTKSISASSQITLNNKQSTFSIQFASLGFVNAKNFTYSYMLQGYDTEWNQIGMRREIDFTNLTPGDYVFMVRAKNSDGAMSEVTQLKIKVLPPWYLTLWAKILWILIIGLVLTSAYKLRIQRLKRQRDKLENEVKLRTQELTQLNNRLEQQNEEMYQQREEIEAQRDELFEKNEKLQESSMALTNNLNSMKMLSNLGKRISASLDINTICRTIHENKAVPIYNDGICLATYYEKYNYLEYSCYLENDQCTQLYDEKIDEITDELTLMCIKNRKEILSGINYNIEVPEKLKQKGYNTCLRLPMFDGTAVEGVVIINSKREEIFSPQEIANIRVIASYTAIAIEKAAAYKIVQSKNKAISGSINYAKTIQEALLTNEEFLKQYFDTAVIYRPRDIVSGDFYWAHEQATENGKMIFVSVIDCTGHGVPGAFMSIIANTVLNEIVKIQNKYNPSEILDTLSDEITRMLKQEKTNNKDGMDMALLRFDCNNNGEFEKAYFSAAKNPVFYIPFNKDEVEILKADRKSIAGGFKHVPTENFTQTELSVNQGDIFYMISDGITDQNNKFRQRFGRSKLINILKTNALNGLEQQKTEIENALDNFMLDADQRDDITVIGIKIKNIITFAEK